jgi:DNA segregation ATPase FtsK/SpoIIIE, S-DNA-T family
MGTPWKGPALSTDEREPRETEPDPGAEIVPAQDAPVDDTALLPAVRAEPGELGRAPARVIYADITSREAERRPVVPVHLQRENLRATVTTWSALNWHRIRYHSLRSPVYLLAVLVWAVAGVLRLAARAVHWWFLVESSALRSKAVIDGDSRQWERLHKTGQETRRVRGLILLGISGAVTLAVSLLIRFGPVWSWVAAGTPAVLLLARAGRPEGHRIVSQAIVPPDYSPPTHEIISRALGSLNIAQINAALKPDKDGRAQGIRFITDVMRDGPGWSCHLDLPHGVSASDILARRESLASGLRRPLSATWPAGVPEEHPGRLDLWVGFQDISKAKAATCPLVKARQTDLFNSIPFGTSPRGRGVSVPMFEVNWLIGASPGQGKTAAVRLIACGAALDPLADIWIHELAGKGDLDPLGKVCHRYVSGLDGEAIAYAAESARLLRNETERRSAKFKQLRGSGELPDGKVTREAAARHRELRPLVAIFDEIQNLITDGQYGEQAAEDLAYVVRVGRAYGIVAVLSTQRPDAKIIPTALTGLIVSRFCLMVPDQPANDLVLGTTSYRRGYDSTCFRPKLDAGLGWLKGGEDGIPQICKTYYLDLPATDRIATRARDIRDRAGVLTGYALGELDTGAEARDVLADVLAVFDGAPGLHWDEIADRLAARWPDRWADVTGDAISAQMRSKGVPSVMVSTSGVKARGCRRVAVERESAR